MKLNNADTAQRVEASTFQVFVAVIECHEQQEILTYASIYKSTALYIISRMLNIKNLVLIMARIVTDTLWSPADVSIPCKIATGKPFVVSWRIGSSWGNQVTRFAVEIILFTYFHWQKEITKHIKTSNTRYVGLIGTGSRLEIVEFVYLVFASFTMVFVMTPARCNTLLVYINSICYTRYLSLVDHTKRNFAINESA